MKNVFYLSLIVLFAFSGCVKKTPTPTPTPTATVDPPPTMNYIKFTLNGPGISNKTFTYSKAKNFIQSYEYSETTMGVIYALIDFADKNGGDTLVQVHFDSNTPGNKPFSPSTNAVYLKFLNIKTGYASTSTIGSFQISAFTPTQLVTNGTSGTQKGKFSIAGTFSGTLEEDNTGELWTISGGEIKLDGL